MQRHYYVDGYAMYLLYSIASEKFLASLHGGNVLFVCRDGCTCGGVIKVEGS